MNGSIFSLLMFQNSTFDEKNKFVRIKNKNDLLISSLAEYYAPIFAYILLLTINTNIVKYFKNHL